MSLELAAAGDAIVASLAPVAGEIMIRLSASFGARRWLGSSRPAEGNSSLRGALGPANRFHPFATVQEAATATLSQRVGLMTNDECEPAIRRFTREVPDPRLMTRNAVQIRIETMRIRMTRMGKSAAEIEAAVRASFGPSGSTKREGEFR